MNDHELAAHIAVCAGDLLIAIRDEALTLEVEQSELKARGDARSNELILSMLAEHRPNDAVLSEESKDDLSRLDAERVWIVDPVDGTREYSEARSDWAVHVALVVAGAPIAAAVALPGLDRVLSTDPAETIAPPSDGPIRLVVSRTRPPKLAEDLAGALGAVLVPMGSAGAKAMSVLLGDSDVYAHGGGQYEWDSCAPVGVARAAGLHCSRLDGSALVYNNADPYLPDLLVCRPELAALVLPAIEQVQSG